MNEDGYVAVDEVAERLGLPLGVLVRRVQAGDVPARRIDGPDGPRYELRLSDLGIENNYTFEPTTIKPEAEARSAAGYGDLEVELAGTTAGEATDSVEAEVAIQEPEWPSAIDEPEWLTQTPKALAYENTEPASGWEPAAPAAQASTWEPATPAAQASTWEPATATAQASTWEPTTATATAEAPAWQPANATAEAIAETYPADDVTAAVPPPRTESNPSVSLVDYSQAGPLAEIAAMSIDPRELVAGLLDRWERTLEQRIYAEQRQRFETELNSRQTLVKELQLELKSAHAEHAATQSESARMISERDRAIRDRDLEMAGMQAELDRAYRRKRGWFFRR